MYSPPDSFDAYADVLEQATAGAMRQWFTTDVDPAMRPAMVAAADDPEDEQPMHLGALLGAVTAWLAVWDTEVAPVAEGLLAMRMDEALRGMGVSPAELATPAELTARSVDSPATRTALERLRGALQAARRAGAPAPADDVEYLVLVPGWPEYVQDFARTRRNMVVGMPEALYRDLVSKMATAARDGLDQWEQIRLARSYLSWEDEGGYDQWITRASRIARTETNNLVNAADLQAARTEEQHTGADVHKVWVATLDPRTRDTHFRLDGQRVPLDGKFMVGGHEADHPSDQRLPPHESINCRCTLMYVRADEDVPDDTDRQTERERSDGTTRSPQAEVRRRGNRGVTRAGDNGQQTVTAAAQTGDIPMRKQWTGTLAPVGKPTGDGRIFDTDAELTFREFPLPLMFQRATSDGHDTAVIVGKITSATVDAEGVQAVGEFFDSAEAAEAVELVAEGVLRPSVDLADMVVEHELLDADGNAVDLDDEELAPDDIAGERMHVRAASIIAATLVAKPAFAEAKITIGDDTPAPAEDDAEAEEAALVASATALTEVPAFPADAFADPRLDGPTALTVTDDGRVYGHLATWSTEHLSRPGTTPPRSATSYALFHTSTVRADTGQLSVGRLTVGTGHADARASAHATAEHYDNTGSTWAFVRAGEDQHGTWVAGVVNPDADPKDVRAGASAPLSGDWRNVGGNLELVAALSVNVGGFPIPRSYAATSGAELSLVASGVVRPRRRADELADAVAEGLRRHEQRKAEAELAEDEAFKEAERLAATRRMAAKVWAMEVNR